MSEEYPLEQMAQLISDIRLAASKLRELCGGIPAVERNMERILASVRMLELNISDVLKVMEVSGGEQG